LSDFVIFFSGAVNHPSKFWNKNISSHNAPQKNNKFIEVETTRFKASEIRRGSKTDPKCSSFLNGWMENGYFQPVPIRKDLEYPESSN